MIESIETRRANETIRHYAAGGYYVLAQLTDSPLMQRKYYRKLHRLTLTEALAIRLDRKTSLVIEDGKA